MSESASKSGVHPTVDYGIIHAVRHRKPVNAQENFLDVRFVRNLRKIRRYDEVHVKR